MPCPRSRLAKAGFHTEFEYILGTSYAINVKGIVVKTQCNQMKNDTENWVRINVESCWILGIRVIRPKWEDMQSEVLSRCSHCVL